ncbi:DUF1772 domain-containing protein [Paludibaculum fermentans]|uniref:DUF1772 domain-containing protein n=1 Tax=Paludibaculum fermentans TaxID=1473598 RepID=UPI003EC13E0F
MNTKFSALRFWSLFFTVLALATGFAHLLALPNKINFSGGEYLAAQQSYRGWAWLGVVILLAIAFDTGLAISVRNRRPDAVLAGLALGAMIGTQVIFWAFTFPVNVATQNWTVQPAGWEALRARWEYSHAASAVLELIAVVALLFLNCRVTEAGTNGTGTRPRWLEV